jgi:hypothetical protein
MAHIAFCVNLLTAPTKEFFCQHPRWAQRSRHDKGMNRAPCSVYLHHSKSRNISVYFIITSREEDWVASLRQQLRIDDYFYSRNNQLLSLIAEDPFSLHAIISGIALQQSVSYVTAVREGLMNQASLLIENGLHNEKLLSTDCRRISKD